LDPVIDKAGKISTEMLALAKIRHSRLVKDA